MIEGKKGREGSKKKEGSSGVKKKDQSFWYLERESEKTYSSSMVNLLGYSGHRTHGMEPSLSSLVCSWARGGTMRNSERKQIPKKEA